MWDLGDGIADKGLAVQAREARLGFPAPTYKLGIAAHIDPRA